MANPNYGQWEGLAIRWTPQEAWLFSETTQAWEPMEVTEAMENGRLYTPQQFAARFPNMPDLPEKAFSG